MQAKLVLYSILAGILTGFLFDFYRTFRGFENVHKVIIIIEDILFWILAGILIFVFLLYTNQAVMSVYVYIWMIFGVYLYMKLVSKSFRKIQYTLISNISKFFRILINILIYPFRWIFYKIGFKK
ncbi:spore cortex biosynthesis protein YabQ [Clostridium sp. N3C]|uniref:spore cortex biosynthesis protein YabQ n=1 Tax=Clostridium sp. N3C TaxID=1776758 RepID=UPI001FA8AD32|nr:spore cortex biosynthesis protein YabQ [Clostridium sp. N3C]